MLMHFCWKERTSNRAEDDLVIFPEEIEFKKVTQNTTGKFKDENRSVRERFVLGRVYILKWKSTSKKLFFWMQEPKEDKDEEYCRKINNFVRLFGMTNFILLKSILVKQSTSTWFQFW